MTYRILVEDRKKVVSRLEIMTGRKPVYTRMPRCAYVLDGIVIEKDNTITTDGDADMSLIEGLIEGGLIEPVESSELTGPEDETEEVTTESADTETEEAAEAVPADTEEAEEDAPALEEQDEHEEEQVSETRTEPDEEQPETLIEIEEDEEEEQEQQDLPEGPDRYAILEDRYAELETPEPAKVVIALPMTGHRAESVCNLVFTIFTRGKLLSKSTEGDFFASKELVEDLHSGNIVTIEDAVRTIVRAGEDALRGLAFRDMKVVFDGFPVTDDPDKIKAWTALAAAMNKAAIRQHHIHAKELNEPNEKFAFRTWLTRIKMNGPELKEERKILYQNLSGHTAFRTEADKEKWTAKQNAKRKALKELKAAALAEGNETEQNGAED